jgi:hypothetical protein
MRMQVEAGDDTESGFKVMANDTHIHFSLPYLLKSIDAQYAKRTFEPSLMSHPA